MRKNEAKKAHAKKVGPEKLSIYDAVGKIERYRLPIACESPQE